MTDARFEAAYRALRSDRAVQFDLRPPPPPRTLPAWVRTLGHWAGEMLAPIGRFFRWVTSLMPTAPYARILLWTILVVLAAAILTVVIDRLRSGVWRRPRWGRQTMSVSEAAEWVPAEAPARTWLEEADALAAGGAYAEAVHHLLRRSVEDIARRRPNLLRPALTSRDIAVIPALPAQARAIFGNIAGVVERSLFGGRAVGAEDWTRCRADYEEFVRARAWSA